MRNPSNPEAEIESESEIFTGKRFKNQNQWTNLEIEPGFDGFNLISLSLSLEANIHIER